MNSDELRKKVMNNYDLIANQYTNEYGKIIEDKEIIDKLISLLNNNSKVIDLGGGPGQLTNYLISNKIDATCYDFSINMKNNALKLYPNIPYIVDDIVNIKEHFNNKTQDAVIALYSLFHIPKNEMNNLLVDINNILKKDGYFLLTIQLGNGEYFVDEPYLNEEGKNCLYMNYYSKEEIETLLTNNNFKIIYQFEKIEKGENVIEKENKTLIIISQKIN